MSGPKRKRGEGQGRLPGTLPTFAAARKAHKEAIAELRAVEDEIAVIRGDLKDATARRDAAEAKRRTAEDDLEAIEGGAK